MKKLLLPAVAMMLALVSCDLFDLGQEKKKDTMDTADYSVFFQTNDGPALRFADFDLYDSSTCIFYLKSVHPELENMDLGSFAFLEGTDTIYSGKFWPAYLSSIPDCPFIITNPIFFNSYVLRIGNWYAGKPDPRNGEAMISALQKRNLLHRGLSVQIISLNITVNRVDLSIQVTNADNTDLLILDPGKMGSPLFHYFTTGLYLHSSDHQQYFFSTPESESPVPGYSWGMDWLTELKSGESRIFQLNYTLNAAPSSGSFIAGFTFPGLGREVLSDQLYQGDARIWLGDARATKRITIH
jgi:hypothetical protein